MPALTLRPITDDDLPFLRRLYGTIRAEEMAMVADWTDERKEAFVDQQFAAQHHWYQEHYTGARFEVVEVDGVPAGRLYVHRRPAEIRLVDISFLPEFRGRGLGGSLLRDLLTEGERARKPVTIHVEKYNPALRLYQRLGFQPIADRGVYWLLEWVPPGGKSVREGEGDAAR